jgi:O-methyltransferase
VDIYRCWELWTLVGDTASLGGGIIEIGVWRGGTSALIAKKAALSGILRPVYSCDTFRGVVKAGVNDPAYKGGEHADTSCDVVKSLNSRLNLTNVRILEGIFPDETAHLIPAEEQTFSLCHIDVDVYQSAFEIVEWIWGRLLRGGVIVYDDYGFKVCEGIRQFVDEQRALRDRRVIYNLNGHGLVLKL